MLICFEGPSAIGKTTLCETFTDDFEIIPEANILFGKELAENRASYLFYQKERYQRSVMSSKTSILDGDIFQPLWYNWAYDFPEEYQSLEDLDKFYSEEISGKFMKFPDLYIVFTASTDELRKRKDADMKRSRRNFEKHLNLVEVQKTYFQFLSDNTTIPVEFIKYENTEDVREVVLEKIAGAKEQTNSNVQNLKTILDFLKKPFSP